MREQLIELEFDGDWWVNTTEKIIPLVPQWKHSGSFSDCLTYEQN